MTSDSAESEYEIYRARIGIEKQYFNTLFQAQMFGGRVAGNGEDFTQSDIEWRFSDDPDTIVGWVGDDVVAHIDRVLLNPDVETALKRHKKQERKNDE